jgi:glutathione synthase/RimK-type ligase-like ATP-grasp enzyme
VLTIGKDIAQTVLKKRNGSSWKATGVYGNSFSKFRIDHKLKKIVKKLIKVSKIDVCGMDFARREDKWLVIEVNPEPAFDFFEDERRNLVKKVLLYLKRYKL